MTPKRVFILGLQRSGTTWLANMLAALPQVAAVEDERHRGVHESVFFSHFARAFGSWENPEARARFFASFATSDYAILSGLGEELLHEFEETKHSFGDVFISLMDLLAESEGCDAWIEKSPHHTLLADEILFAAPDAIFVMVQRNPKDLILSRLHGFGRKPSTGFKRWRDILRGAFAITLYQREMKRLSKNSNALLISYEEMLQDKSMKLRQKIIDHIGINADPAEMESVYEGNTSFDKTTKKPLSLVDQLFLGIGLCVAKCTPLNRLKSAQAERDEQRGIVFPEWVWTINPSGKAEKSASQHEIILDYRRV